MLLCNVTIKNFLNIYSKKCNDVSLLSFHYFFFNSCRFLLVLPAIYYHAACTDIGTRLKKCSKHHYRPYKSDINNHLPLYLLMRKKSFGVLTESWSTRFMYLRQKRE